MKTILVPVDFSPTTAAVVRTASTLARALSGRIVLLNVVQIPTVLADYSQPVAAMQDSVQNAVSAATRRLAKMTQRFRAAGLRSRALVREGTTVSIILEEAKRFKANYIIMGSHGHGKLYDLLAGSTASGVIKRAPCAVVLLPPRPR